MKPIVTAFLATGIALAVLILLPGAKQSITTVSVVHAQGGWSNATLTGNYVFKYSGFNSKHNNYATELPIAAVGISVFDGAGNVTFSYNNAFDGHIGATTTPDVGTYTVNSDCSYTMSDPAAAQTWGEGSAGAAGEFCPH